MRDPRQIDLEAVTRTMVALGALVPAVRRIREAWVQGRYLAALASFQRLRDELDDLEQQLARGAVAAGCDPASVSVALGDDAADPPG